ncbi:MAG: hypothetical protein CMO55_12075 [Verrucomicrobiales bacterium]|nr:hypothetical protein [Verrucomicrobiales bacterium]
MNRLDSCKLEAFARMISGVATRGWLMSAFVSLMFVASARAGTWPGANGLITFELNGNIWVIDPDTLDSLPIAVGGDPAFSPDGNWIVFTSERMGEWDLYIIRPDGADEKQVTSNTSVDEYFPSWVDNDTIIFKSRDDSHSDPTDRQFVTVDVGETPSSNYTIVRGPQEMGDNSLAFPEISSFGTLTFTENYLLQEFSYKTGIWTANGGGTPKMASTFGETANSSGWSPNGQKIVYPEAIPGEFNIDVFINNPNGGAPFNVTNSPSRYEFAPRFSPDGKKIVFSDQEDLYIIDTDGENEQKIVNASGFGANNPDWGIIPGTEYTPTDPAAAAIRAAINRKIKKLVRALKKAKRAKKKPKIKRFRKRIRKAKQTLRNV